ncbi:MAG: aldo/keto reductase, partial [Clostridia bacterium]|nr:aldo/keto reductase [Clostridia bacterium]
MLKEDYVLNNGVKIPKLGLGTWQMSETQAEEATLNALKLGYRQIDTAAAYGNEAGVGRGIKKSGIKREDIFITTKIQAEIKTAEGAAEAIENSLKLLDSDYIDLMLIHAPMPWDEICYRKPRPAHRYEKENVAVWKVMEKYLESGKLRAIGLSNFEIHDILNIIENTSVKPAVNQVRCYVGHTPRKAINFAREQGILIQAYSPNATGRLLSNETATRLAEKYKVTVPQLAIRYDLQLGTHPLPKTANVLHME